MNLRLIPIHETVFFLYLFFSPSMRWLLLLLVLCIVLPKVLIDRCCGEDKKRYALLPDGDRTFYIQMRILWVFGAAAPAMKSLNNFVTGLCNIGRPHNMNDCSLYVSNAIQRRCDDGEAWA